MKYTSYTCTTGQIEADIEQCKSAGFTVEYDKQAGTCIIREGETTVLQALQLGARAIWLCRALTHH